MSASFQVAVAKSYGVDGIDKKNLVESKIHRLARYYRTARKLPPNWKYESATASTLVA